jgi:hypothetical protein
VRAVSDCIFGEAITIHYLTASAHHTQDISAIPATVHLAPSVLVLSDRSHVLFGSVWQCTDHMVLVWRCNQVDLWVNEPLLTEPGYSVEAYVQDSEARNGSPPVASVEQHLRRIQAVLKDSAGLHSGAFLH